MPPAVSPPAPPLPVFPPTLLLVYLGSVAGAGVLANCALIFSLLRRFRSGLDAILTQFAIIDLVLIAGSISPEAWCYNLHNWYFGAPAWILHCGLKSFANTATLYFTMTISFHALALANMGQSLTKRRAKNTTEDEETRSSRHSLVASSDSSNPPRMMNVEYRTVSESVPVILPSILIWILAISVSIPEIALATRSTLQNEMYACKNVDSIKHVHTIYSSLTTLNMFVPAIVLCVVCVLIMVKISTKRRMRGAAVERDESAAAMNLSLYFFGVFVLLCLPYIVFSVYQIYWSGNKATVGMTNLSLICLRLTAPLVRPLLCFAALPRLRRVCTKDVKCELV